MSIVPMHRDLPVRDREYDHSPPVQVLAFSEIERIAEYVVKARLYPGYDSIPLTVSLMMLCQSKGINPIQVGEQYDIIKGRHCMKAQTMLAHFQKHGGRVVWERSDAEACEARFFHATHTSPDGQLVTFTMQDAARAGLSSNDNYRKHPAAMLRARCSSIGVRMVMPGIILNIYTPEEMETFDDNHRNQGQSNHGPARRTSPALSHHPADMVVIGQPNPGGHDSRAYHEVVTNAAAKANADWLASLTTIPPGISAPKEVVTRAQIHGLVWKVAKSEGLVEGDQPSKVGIVIEAINPVYAAHRKWVREQIAAIVEERQLEASSAVEAQLSQATDEADLGDDGADDDIEPEGREPGDE